MAVTNASSVFKFEDLDITNTSVEDDDDCSADDEFSLKIWPDDNKPSVIVFRGKSDKYVRAVSSLKFNLKKGAKRTFGSIDTQVLDNKKSKSSNDIILEIK